MEVNNLFWDTALFIFQNRPIYFESCDVMLNIRTTDVVLFKYTFWIINHLVMNLVN